MRRVLGAIGATVVGLVLTAGTAAAHVTIQPGEATKGGFATLFVQVPNEKSDASTTQVELTLPSDHPLAFVSVEPVPGWTITPEKSKLAEPITSDDGEVTEAVTKITFTGGTIAPGQFQRFPISVGPLPTDTDELVFKAVQTYSDGDVVRWIEPVPASGEEPEHPAPTVTLVAGADEHGSTTTTTAASTSSSEDSSDDTLAIVGIGVGAVAIVLALVALLRRPKAA